MPYSIGLQSAANAFVSAGFAIQFTVAVITFFAIILITSSFQKDAPDAPDYLPGMSLFHIVPFYQRRFDFLNWGIHATGQSIFQFKLLRNTVMVISGESGRQAFFSAKGLNLTEGFNILSGAIPSVRGVTTDLQNKRIATIHKRVVAAQREGHLTALMPQLLEDSRKVMERWGNSGKFDPFEKIYELTFQTTIRSLSCSEIADDLELVSRIKQLYDQLDTGTTPSTILLPWLPSWAMAKKLWSTKEIYDIIVDAVKKRQDLLTTISEGERPQDTMQLLLDAGDDRMAVVGFIMGLLIAGARATGTSGSWLVTFLASHPEWANKARIEVEELVASHTDSRVSGVRLPAAARVSTSPTSSPLSSAFPPRSTSCQNHHNDIRRKSRSSTLSQKRKRCDSDPGSDLDSNSELRQKEKIDSIGFADVDNLEKSLEEGRIMSGPASLQNVGEARKRKDTFVAGVKDHIPVPLLPRPASCSTTSPPPTSTTSETSSKDERYAHSISQTLKCIPLEVWERSTPVLDALIKETLRVAQPHTAMRRNVGPEFYIDGKRIPSGAYVVYPFSDVHLDEDIYEDAWKFDPGRWLNGDETETKGEKGVPFGYVGWGGGKHMCLGTRLAKVELKLIISMFLLGFDLSIVDKHGKSKDELPKPNWNDILLCRPPKGSFYLGFERKEGILL
ncbi:hypothetical protein Agabi119p4_8042 [Agaricus bisporus var. burnettii]|uniref:Lanosterol 14-alpha-demethylase n=1 Tax=Agaricus bisporus var. burnettii TaxID=192524 RepID=A0A8H7C5I4_AGABI|nr:hypothetical protein Agabi119p4_8042 [Agaricus bisporus var. burnettii]